MIGISKEKALEIGEQIDSCKYLECSVKEWLLDECVELDPWLPIEDAPKDRKIIAYNPYFGQYITRYTNGQWPCFGALELGGVKISTEYGASIHFPKPTHYKELSKEPKNS